MSRQQKAYEILTQVGPGTAMGNLMRRFWLPALLESEIPAPDCPPVRLRLLCEDLVAFRDTEGRIGILDAHCPHRGASLFYGRNEQCGLRCVYHGWKFDVDGRCVDLPSEPPESKLRKELIRATAYPTRIRGGVVWVYMGPPEALAEPPEFEWSRLPPLRRTAIKRLQRCNWAQAVEGGIDSSHVSFLHGHPGKNENAHLFADVSPVFHVDESPAGLVISARRNAGDANYYWRITQFLLPFYTMIPPVGTFLHSGEAAYDGHAWVPIDDETTWTWSFAAHPHRDFTPEELEFRGGRNGMWGPVDEHYHPLLHGGNDYRIDRDRQRRENFTGIDGIPNQDAAVQESMGAISNRAREHLGHSDRAIIQFRQLMIRLARNLAKGEAPAAVMDGRLYNVRSASVTLPRDTPVRAGTAPYTAGAPLTDQQ